MHGLVRTYLSIFLIISCTLQKKRKTLKKFHQFHKSYTEYPGNSSDTSSSNSNGFLSGIGSTQMNKNGTPNTKVRKLLCNYKSSLLCRMFINGFFHAIV